MRLTDVHVHLPEYPDPSEVVRNAVARGARLFSSTINSSQAELNLRLAMENPDTVKCFLGIHPSEASKEVVTLPGDPFMGLLQGCDGIGEIGLDPKYSEAGVNSAQMRRFVAQLEAAERLNKPVQVHSRGTEIECIQTLGTFRLKSVLMHWFEGQQESAVQSVLSKGYYVSFGPALLYSKKIRRLAERIPEERLLTESDGPVSFNAVGGAGGPDVIASVLFGLAELRGRNFADMGIIVDENASEYLKH
jgi:TatD DNase family protein